MTQDPYSGDWSQWFQATIGTVVGDWSKAQFANDPTNAPLQNAYVEGQPAASAGAQVGGVPMSALLIGGALLVGAILIAR